MILFSIIASLISIAFAFVYIYSIKKYSPGFGKQIEIWEAIKDGSRAYLRRQNMTLTVVAGVCAIILWYIFGGEIASGFVLGAFASGLAGYLGMMTAVDANVRTTEAARSGMPRAFRVAFLGGSVTGFLVVGLGLFSVTLFYAITQNVSSLVGLAFGSSLISVFARLGGGIFTKGADVGADLVGKLEAGIPEDDPRNPAVIADNVGDNVGDDAGMAADLFETYVVTAIAAMILGNLLFPGFANAILLPLALGAISIFASVAGFFFVRLGKKGYIMGALYKGLAASALLAAAGFYPILQYLTKNVVDASFKFWPFYLSTIVGLVVTAGMVLITEYYTSKSFKPVKSIAQESATGHGT